jgi:hypothetical protein
MNNVQHTEQCKQMRSAPDSLWASLKQRLFSRCSEHIASCPRCQKRLAAANRVEMTLSLMRMQPQAMDLLAKANTAALKYLTRTVRFSPCADQLRTAVHKPNRLEKASPLLERLLNVAACLFIILMIRVGLKNRMLEIQDQGTKVMENYYARNLDAKLFEDVFGQPPNLNA